MKEVLRNKSKIKPLADNCQYSRLHIGNSLEEITEFTTVIPISFRGNSLLNVGADSEITAQAIGKKIGAKNLQVVEPSAIAFPYARSNLREFELDTVDRAKFKQFEASNLFDLTTLIDILEHINDPADILKKASKISRFALIRVPFEDNIAVRAYKQFGGEDIQQLMEQQHGHVHRFSQDSLRNLLNNGGFDIIHDDHFRISQQALILGRRTSRLAENLSWKLANKLYPDIWGGLYVAFLKSRNPQIMNPESEQVIQNAIKEEFGEKNLVSIGLFGSTTRGTSKRYSDFDFTVILEYLPDNIYEREQASPRLKKRLQEKEVGELCAFNLYTREEFEQAATKNAWLLETMKLGYRILYDQSNFLEQKFTTEKPAIKKIGSFAWLGVDYEDGTHTKDIIERHIEIAAILQTSDPEIAAYHLREAQREKFNLELLIRGAVDSKDSLLGLAKKLQHTFGVPVDMEYIQEEEYTHEIHDKKILYDYDQTERHLRAATILETAGKPLDALFHSYVALRNIYLYILHNNDQYIIDGEVTQLFLKEFGNKIPPYLVDAIYNNSFKAEQILGRSGYISFDLDKKGKPMFEDPSKSNFDYSLLLSNLRGIIGNMQEQTSLFLPYNRDNPIISLVISPSEQLEHLEKCLETVNNLVIPKGKVELIVIDNGSLKPYFIEQLQKTCKFPFKFIKNEQSDINTYKNRGIEEGKGKYIAFLNDDKSVSPLWLVQLMSGFKDEYVAGVGSTNLAYPNSSTLQQYIDYREIESKFSRDETGQILHILTGAAIIRKDILEEIGGFRIQQTTSEAQFGDIDLGRRIRNNGYQFKHIDSAITFSNHKNSLRNIIKRNIENGEDALFHCVDLGIKPSDQSIPDPKLSSVATDILYFVSRDMPKQAREVYRNHLGLKKALQYPLLDLLSRVCYNIGVLRGSKLLVNK